MIRTLLTLTACLFVFLPSAGTAQVRNYPEKPVKIIVPYAPGGFNDTMARVVGKKLQDAWGQPLVVENRPGAGTVLGTGAAAKSPNDGYTLLVVGFPLVANQFLYKKLPYDSAKDFTGIILGAQSPNLLVVNAASPIRSVKDLVDLAKSKTVKLSYATAGNGTSNHLTMEYFKNLAGVELTQVPYKGSAPMVTDLLGGHVDVMFDNAGSIMPHVKAGRMRALGITSLKRSPLLPDVPTISEAGFPGFEVAVWYGFAAPAGTPPEIVAKLNSEINRILALDDVKKAFTDAGVEVLGGTTQQFDAFFKTQSARWATVIQAGNLTAE
ncbi:MAG: tripartite tricarboxylate transporter substrate binding protein [Herminiimonas sp.]|nr:tripartite tricarboxylate transporter substrate binding protein [Herminiimonas sp.]